MLNILCQGMCLMEFDNDVFAKQIRLTMKYLRSFLVFAQLIILFGIVLSAAAPAEARKRHIVNVLCKFCGKSFPNSWAYERHRTFTKHKGSLKNRLLLASYAQSGAIGNQSWYNGKLATAMLSRSLSQGHRGSYVLTRK